MRVAPSWLRHFSLLVLSVAASLAVADTNCPCDASHPETMQQRQCSLCAEAEKAPAGQAVFFVKDVNPRKPNRTLALPRIHAAGIHRIADLPPETQAQLWTAAINKARELFGEEGLGIAFNGDHVRTQCHTHIHIGQLLPGVETGNFFVVDSPAKIPPPDDNGYWIHPAGTKPQQYHVHRGEQITETVLLR